MITTIIYTDKEKEILRLGEWTEDGFTGATTDRAEEHMDSIEKSAKMKLVGSKTLTEIETFVKEQ